MYRCLFLAFWSVFFSQAKADESGASVLSEYFGRTIPTQDSLNSPTDDNPDAQSCLNGLCWESDHFNVHCSPPTRRGPDAVLRFPSARSTEIPQNDSVRVEWYALSNDAGKVINGPAMVVVHESGRGMTVGRMVARGIRDRGIHAFMVQLPFYGSRRPASVSVADQNFGTVMEQGIADVRRTRDAVAALPCVEANQISLQGTSLGGFLSATTAGLDDAFKSVFILLAGGDLPKLIATGERETAQVKELLATQGYVGERMHKLLNRFEPNRLAHRISAERLWLFSASFDTTVPPVHADSFAKAAGLNDDHHVRLPATHYSGVIFLPVVLDQSAPKAGGRAILKKSASE